MTNEKLKELQNVLQHAANTAWDFRMSSSQYSYNPTSFGDHLECVLSNRSREISSILDDIAREEQTLDPPNFKEYIRYSSNTLSHKEVFVGDKWVLVPNDACVDFRTSTLSGSRAFTATISHENNYATYTSTESLKSYSQRYLQSDKLNIKLQNDYVSKEERDWMLIASQVYGTTKKNIGGLGDATELYNKVPKEFKRHYAYKISKVAKKVGKPAKAGKIFHGAEKIMKKAGKIAKVGPYLSAGTIGYELTTDNWNAHTVVDGTLLVVGIVATSVGAPVVIVGIAIYGILDYAFDISEGIDKHFGRKSDFWNEKPILNFPIERRPLFNEVKIDNTYVAPKFKPPLNFKN